MLAPVRTVAPTKHMLALDDVKLHLRVDGNDEDALIEGLRDTATQYLDGYTGILGRALLSQTWRQDWDYFPGDDKLYLPLGPIISLTSVTYYDAANVQQTLSSSVYAGPFTDERGPYVVLKFGQVWPITYYRNDAVSATFVCGYADADAVPRPIRQAALIMIADWYDSGRESTITGDRAVSAQIPIVAGAKALLAPFRRSWA